jgi:hypothetical protein
VRRIREWAERPSTTGPAADLSQELTSAGEAFIGSPFAVPLEPRGYVQQELVASGTAVSFRPQCEPASDGRWAFVPDESAPYRTRIVVRRPNDLTAFSGTVVLEWLNVSGGLDADPEWASVHEEVLRRGHVWIGMSAQRVGVMGGPVLVEGIDDPRALLAGKGLRGIDPTRYGSLDHPGDGFSFDMFTQVARAIRSGSASGGQQPQRVIAAGESQSAAALVTYYNGVQALTREFDGFFVHSRGASGLPLVGRDEHVAIEAMVDRVPTIFRTDGDVPVISVQSEGDVTGLLDSYAARQPDSDSFRLWEVAGTAHADAHLLGAFASSIDCGLPINDGPFHLVVKAGLRAMTTRIEEGKAPTMAPRLEVASEPTPKVIRDADGIAVGGIRTPPVDVPVAALSGEPGPAASVLCLLLGSTRPFTAERIAQLYPSRAEYLRRYTESADKTVESGFVLAEDRESLLAFANPSAVPA